MKKTFPILLCILCLLSSCRTREKVIYFQDVKNGDAIRTQVLETMKLSPGDKVSIVVSSSATPELAAQYNLPIITIQGGGTARSYNNQIALYTLDEEGNIDIPTLGRVKIGGITRSEAATKIQSMLRQNLLRDAVVTISAYDQYVTVLGEVKIPAASTSAATTSRCLKPSASVATSPSRPAATTYLCSARRGASQRATTWTSAPRICLTHRSIIFSKTMWLW